VGQGGGARFLEAEGHLGGMGWMQGTLSVVCSPPWASATERGAGGDVSPQRISAEVAGGVPSASGLRGCAPGLGVHKVQLMKLKAGFEQLGMGTRTLPVLDSASKSLFPHDLTFSSSFKISVLKAQ